MDNSIGSRLKKAWNIFFNKDPTPQYEHGQSYYYRPDRPRISTSNERSISNVVYTRIAMDVATLDFRHVQMDENNRFQEERDSKFNRCLTLSPNIDQTARSFIMDVVISMFDEGHVAIVATDTTDDPRYSESYDILSMRTGKVVEWFPYSVKVECYNEQIGKKEDVILPKNCVAIIENPFYQIMNVPNSAMKRLIRKMNLLDSIDENNSSGKLDLIIQLPYVIKSQARKEQAEARRKDIEEQLSGSKYGIAYTDGTERITQLNRPIENTLQTQIEYLTNTVFAQLGITQGILDGTADEKTMTNYNSRIIEPIASSIVDEMKRKFLSRTAITQGQSVEFFRDPFRLVPVNDMAEIADKFTRNEILSSNEIRQSIGIKPSKDPKADELINANINQSKNVEEKYVKPNGNLANQNGKEEADE